VNVPNEAQQVLVGLRDGEDDSKRGYDLAGQIGSIIGTKSQEGDNQIGRKKSRWGPMVAERRSIMIQNDGRTSLEKAQGNKMKDGLEDIYTKDKK
jgi:hypothetical protein